MLKKHSLVYLVAYTVVGIYLTIGGFYRWSQSRRDKISSQHISHYLCKIIQTGPQKEALNTIYLAELMHISADRPVLLSEFNLKLAKYNLLQSPVIKDAFIKIISPDTLYIDYTIRQPVARLADFENVAFDSEYIPFPIFPFFTPKNLLQIYLGVDEIVWNKPLPVQKTKLALDIVNLLTKTPLNVKCIDVSKAFEDNLGTKEIILTLEEHNRLKYLRLTPKNINQEIGNYLELRGQLASCEQTIDLRIPQIAFIHDEK